VVCRHCESKPVMGRRRSSAEPEPVEGPGTGVRDYLCEVCGSVLPASESDEFLLRRLSQFARFGIGAESAPLLTDTSQLD